MGHMTDQHASNLSEDDFTSWDAQTQQVHWPLGGVLTSEYAPALRALGLLDPTEDAQQLGKGGFGVAYKVKIRGRVGTLKLTRDPMEVVASWLLRGRDTQHVVHVHEVWSLPKMQQHEHWASWWVIHRDYLHDVGDKDGALLETIFDFWKDDDFALRIPRLGDAGRGMREKWRATLRNDTDCTQIEIERSLLLLDQIARGIKELGQVGIEWTDILPDNLMRDGKGQLRVSDVGLGLAKHDVECEPPELTVALARSYVGL